MGDQHSGVVHYHIQKVSSPAKGSRMSDWVGITCLKQIYVRIDHHRDGLRLTMATPNTVVLFAPGCISIGTHPHMI
jgi:hypothetical protein